MRRGNLARLFLGRGLEDTRATHVKTLADGNCLRLSCGHDWGPRIENGVKTLGRIVAAALDGR